MIVRPGLRRRGVLFASMSPNGRIVHLAGRGDMPICGQKTMTEYRVFSRVTCARCARKAPSVAGRLAARPKAIGIDHEPFYAAVRRALDAGATRDDSPEAKQLLRQERVLFHVIYENVATGHV